MYKELERVLKITGIDLSVDKVLSIAKTITTIKIRLLLQNKTISQTLILTKQHKLSERMFSEEYWQYILEF
jgi:aldehyde:ferredoxin oxidoreductase